MKKEIKVLFAIQLLIIAAFIWLVCNLFKVERKLDKPETELTVYQHLRGDTLDVMQGWDLDTAFSTAQTSRPIDSLGRYDGWQYVYEDTFRVLQDSKRTPKHTTIKPPIPWQSKLIWVDTMRTSTISKLIGSETISFKQSPYISLALPDSTIKIFGDTIEAVTYAIGQMIDYRERYLSTKQFLGALNVMFIKNGLSQRPYSKALNDSLTLEDWHIKFR